MKVASIYGHIPSKRKLKESAEWPLPRCNIGLEWEFELATNLMIYIQGLRNNNYVTLKEDGSLRDRGIEVVTVGDGLFGEDLSDAIALVAEAVRTATPICNYRTGFHVHIDIRDMEEKELHNMLLLYCLLEKPIFNFVGRDRWKSNFCVPWFRSDNHFVNLRELESFNAKTAPAIASKLRSLSRYSALNCQSIAKFGTLEFRHLENDNKEILTKQKDFIKIVMLLKKLAQKEYANGIFGSVLYEKFRAMSGYELIRYFGYNLPTTDWDYGETLMSAITLVDFHFPKAKIFNDLLFQEFAGNHPAMI